MASHRLETCGDVRRLFHPLARPDMAPRHPEDSTAHEGGLRHRRPGALRYGRQAPGRPASSPAQSPSGASATAATRREVHRAHTMDQTEPSGAAPDHPRGQPDRGRLGGRTRPLQEPSAATDTPRGTGDLVADVEPGSEAAAGGPVLGAPRVPGEQQDSGRNGHARSGGAPFPAHGAGAGATMAAGLAVAPLRCLRRWPQRHARRLRLGHLDTGPGPAAHSPPGLLLSGGQNGPRGGVARLPDGAG